MDEFFGIAAKNPDKGNDSDDWNPTLKSIS
jgi:hypothetical protein